MEESASALGELLEKCKELYKSDQSLKNHGLFTASLQQYITLQSCKR